MSYYVDDAGKICSAGADKSSEEAEGDAVLLFGSPLAIDED